MAAPEDVQRAHRHAVWAAAAIPFLVFAIPLTIQERSFFTFFDAQHQTFAWLQKIARSLSDGYVPLWDSNTFSGHSFVGEFQTGGLYPIQLIWAAVLGSSGGISPSAADVLVLLHLALASVGMVLVLRELGLDAVPSLCGALGFALLGAVPSRASGQPNIFFGLALLPFAIWTALKYRDGGKIRWAHGTGAVFALQLLAGHGQPAIHTGVLVVAVYLGPLARAAPPAHVWRVARGLSAAALSTIVIAGPQLVLSWQYLRDAYRWVGAENPLKPGEAVPYEVFATQYMFEPRDFLNALDPWKTVVNDGNVLYFGTFPLLLVASTLILFRKLDAPVLRREGAWLAATAVFAVLAMLGHNTPLAAVLRHLPVLGQVRQLGRYAILTHFVACVATAASVQAWRDAPEAIRLSRREGTIASALFTLWLAWLWTGEERTIGRLALAHLALAFVLGVLALAWPRIRKLLPVITAGVILAHSVSFSKDRPGKIPPNGLTAAFDTGALRPKLRELYSHARVLVDQDSGLSENVADVVGFESKMGHGATMYRPFFDFLCTGWEQDSDVNDLLNVGYVLSAREQPLELVASDLGRGLRLYQRTRYYPRVFLASQLGRPDPDLAREIELETIEYTDHFQRFRLRSAQEEIAIVSEVAYPGWCATVNGKATPLYKVAISGKPALLRGVRVDAGQNVLEFRYRPWSKLVLGCS